MAKEPQSDEDIATPAHQIRVETSLEGLEFDESPIIQAVRSVVGAEQCAGAEIDIILVDDEYLRELKHEFFGQDVYTDVISFRLNPYDESKVDGEIYISLHRAAEQAMEYDVTADVEILRLAIHGTLHLLGYEDDTKEKKATMTSKEDKHLTPFDEPLIVKHLP